MGSRHDHSNQTADGHANTEYYRSFLEQLLDVVCNGEEETVSEVISVIRSGASHDEILAAMPASRGSGGQERRTEPHGRRQ
jgi:Mg2+/Co2+ transporter CorC